MSSNNHTAYFCVGENWDIQFLVWLELKMNLSRFRYQLICMTYNLGMHALLTPYERQEEMAIFRTLILKYVELSVGN